MEKIKQKIVEINQTGGIESQATYYTNFIKINEIIIRGNLEINILALIRDRENSDETSIFLEIYNLDVPNNIIENNYIQFNFDYRDFLEEDYSFDDELLKAILQTVRIPHTNYK